MWNKDRDSGKWISASQSVSKDIYEGYKQDQIKVRMYSKCLSGAVYFPTSDVNNLYTMTKYRNKLNWYYGTSSEYAIQQLPLREMSLIDHKTLIDYKSYMKDYGMTVKNLFTPEKLIDNTFYNYYNVDVATTGHSDMIASMVIENVRNLNIQVDGITLINGHTVLVKDLFNIEALPNDVAADTYFRGNYYIQDDFNPSTIDYKYSNEYNGIYTYTDGFLVKTDAFKSYNSSFNLAVVPKLGLVNVNVQFHLSRLLNGLFPVDGDPIEFIKSRNWIMRNILDYNNIFDVVLTDILKTDAQVISTNGSIYTLEPRVISIGEFGTIINTEIVNGAYRSHLIHTKYRETLRSISETSRYYWVCGKVGTLLKIDKITFEIENIDLGISTDFNKIYFNNALNGVVVGDFGVIYITSDGGVTWKNIKFDQFSEFMFTDVYFYKLNQIFITGKVGTFIELNIVNGSWKPWVKKLITTVDYYDEYLLYDDVSCIKYCSVPIEINKSDSEPIIISEYFIMGTSGGQLILKTFDEDNEFIFLKVKDINAIRGISLSGSDASATLFIISDTIHSIVLTDVMLSTGGNYAEYKDDTETILVINAYVNAIEISNNTIFSCGNASGIFKNINDGSDTVPTIIDTEYGKYDKSKLLFLDYGIASKLNFYDDNGNYILPSKINISGTLNQISLSNVSGEQNWIDYYKDSEKELKFYSETKDSNMVTFSTSFDRIDGLYPLDTLTKYTNDISEIGMSIGLITSDVSRFTQLMPNLEIEDGVFSIGNPKLNRSAWGTFPITAHDLFDGHAFCIMLYRYVMIVKMPSGAASTIGDVFYLDSQYVSTSFVLNRIHTFGGYDFLYFNTNFNENMVKSIVDSPESVVLTNLNKFYTNDDLATKVKVHPISIGYDVAAGGNMLSVMSRFNNKTAYYNMQLLVQYSSNLESGSIESLYSDGFVKFGYSPTYNILNYLNNIDQVVFVPEKIFTAMPIYESIPLNISSGATDINIFIDFGRPKTNLMSFGKNLEFEWDTLWVNTFVDVELVYLSGLRSLNERLLITKKYEFEGRYILEFDKAFVYNHGVSGISNVNIKSRNTLGLISADLQMMNNIQRATKVKYLGSTYVTNLENDISAKFPTDSYAKILLSDYDIKDKVSGMIYIDDNSNLAFNVINVEHNTVLDINNAYRVGNNVAFTTTAKHGIKNGDYIVISKTNGYVNHSWLGFVSIIQIIDDHTFVINKAWNNPSDTGCSASAYFVESDPFLNYQPVDIMELALDVAPKQAIELNPKNMQIVGNIVSLVGVDYTKFRYTCVDGLTVSKIVSEFPWILNADISNAVIGQDMNGLVWYSGKWNDGRWFGSKWISGEWISGDWYQGTWNSLAVGINDGNIAVSNEQDVISSKWYSGRWFEGTWNGGSWFNGRKYSGVWNGGIWNGGIWNEGTWNDGKFAGGIWVDGIWNGGKFNMDVSPAYWLDGKWQGGDFENGRWFNGEFSEKTKISRFGTLSTNTKNSIWDSGNWIGGEFHSNLNTDADGRPMQSDIHRFSYWKTGTWGGGKFYGGTAYNIRFKSGDWYGGVSEDLEIVNSAVLLDNLVGTIPKIRINGVLRFNKGSEVSLMGSELSNIGSVTSPVTYTVIDSYTDGISYTEIEVISMNVVNDKFKSYLLLRMMDFILRKNGLINPSTMSVVIHNNLTHTNDIVTMDIYEYLELCVNENLDLELTKDPDYVSIINPLTLNSIKLLLDDSVGLIDMNKMDTGMRLVSKFSNADWHSGVWYNGVYESGNFTGGIWYDGKFNGEWGN